MNEHGHSDDVELDEAANAALRNELSFLFGEDIVEQAQLLDIGDINLSDEMASEIAEGMKQLKQLKSDPQAQKQWISKQPPGSQLLLCLWIMDMNLLDRIQARPYR